MDERLKPERGGETLPFYACERMELADAWFRLLSILEVHSGLDHLDRETIWHIRTWMDILMAKKPVPRFLHEPNDIPPRHFLQSDPNIDSEQIALEFYRASKLAQSIDGKGRREV